MAITLIDPTVVPYVSTFLFVFALIFGLLSYSKVGDFNKRVNAMLALAIAGFSVLYEPLVLTLSQYIPIAAGVLIIVFFLALVKKIFEGKEGSKKDYFPLIVVIAILFLLLIALADVFLAFLPGNFDPSVVLWGIGLVFVILFFWLIYKSGDA
ncbi:MAG: hypothetical protein J4400_00070 [Candidatus Aenigmarchaeota archaeon]|nr:hypothetical protein [Candidatus Aenigmarchaeota archaeon]